MSSNTNFQCNLISMFNLVNYLSLNLGKLYMNSIHIDQSICKCPAVERLLLINKRPQHLTTCESDNLFLRNSTLVGEI